jgi:lysophospholipase L1-like esterase
MISGRRDVAVVIASTITVFVVLAIGIEIALRLLLGTAVPGLDNNPLIGTFQSASEIRLAPNPQFATDANGFWVANAARDGINPDGYRSPPLDEPARGRKTLLVLGDSFTWGMSAAPLSEAYPDRLRRAGYKVCNLGIPGLATVQYRAQAERYIPQLKPDAVCLFFYTGNDFDQEPPIVPGRPRNYETNIAELRALRMDGTAIPFDTATREFASWYGAGLWPWTQRRLAATGIATVAGAWSGPGDQALIATAQENIRAVATICEANGAKFLLFLLPTRGELQTALSEGAATHLSALDPLVIPGITPEHYAPQPDAHYNNAGHATVADFALNQLKKAGL